MSSSIQVAFPAVVEGSSRLVVPEAPRTPVNTGLEALVARESAVTVKETLSCAALLEGQTRVEAEAEAQRLLDEMLQNTQIFMAYGTSALEGVNRLIDRLLKEADPVSIPELDSLMKSLNDEMRGIKKKYDVSDPSVREKYENWKGGIGRFFGKAKTLIEMLMEDVKSIEKQIDDVRKKLGSSQYALLKNVTYYDLLYERNEEEILQLIYVIGVMELIRDLAAQRAGNIEVGNAALGDRGAEQQAKLAEFAGNMEIKISEYKGRLMIAWATSPQVRTMRTLNVGMAERLNELIGVTIPTMKGVIVQWRLLIQTEDAAKMSRVVQEQANEWVRAYWEAGAKVAPKIAEAIQTPTLTVQTIEAMADSFVMQTDGIIAAWERGKRLREEVDSAILEAKQVFDGSVQRLNDALIESVVGRAIRTLEIATSLAPSNGTTN